MADKITSSYILGAYQRNDTAINRAIEAVQVKIDKLYKDFFAQFVGLINSQEEIDLVLAARVNEEARVLLQEAGLNDVLQAYLDEYPKLQEKAMQYFVNIGSDPNFTIEHLAELNFFADKAVRDLGSIIERKFLDPFADAIVEGIITKSSSKDIINNLINVQENYSSNEIDLFLDSTNSRFVQLINNAKAEELGLSIFSYQGPRDSKNRPACKFLLDNSDIGVPGLWTRESIKVGMHPDLFLDPFVFKGGYRCRHAWTSITLEYAESLGAKIPKEKRTEILKAEEL